MIRAAKPASFFRNRSSFRSRLAASSSCTSKLQVVNKHRRAPATRVARPTRRGRASFPNPVCRTPARSRGGPGSRRRAGSGTVAAPTLGNRDHWNWSQVLPLRQARRGRQASDAALGAGFAFAARQRFQILRVAQVLLRRPVGLALEVIAERRQAQFPQLLGQPFRSHWVGVGAGGVGALVRRVFAMILLRECATGHRTPSNPAVPRRPPSGPESPYSSSPTRSPRRRTSGCHSASNTRNASSTATSLSWAAWCRIFR